MKKIILPAIIVLLLIAGAVIFSALNPAPRVIIFENELKKTEASFSRGDVKFLNDIGFEKSQNVENNLPAVFEEQAKKYKEAYGLEFFSERVMDKTLETTGLVMGTAKQFTGKIPDRNIGEIRVVMEKIKPVPYLFEGSNFYYGDYIITDNGRVIDVIDDDNPKITNRDILSYARQRNDSWYANMACAGSYPSGSVITYAPHTRWVHQVVFNPEKYPLVVIASPDDFKLEPGQMWNGHKITDKPKVKDPMILLKVGNGYLKLTSWN